MKRKVTFRVVPNFSPAEEIIHIEEPWKDKKWLKEWLKLTREVFSTVLTERFGPLSPDVTKRIQTATHIQLQAMVVRYFDAKTLDEVLGKPKRRPPHLQCVLPKHPLAMPRQIPAMLVPERPVKPEQHARFVR